MSSDLWFSDPLHLKKVDRWSKLNKFLAKFADLIYKLSEGATLSFDSPPIHKVVIFDIIQLRELSSLFAEGETVLFDPRFQTKIYFRSLLVGLYKYVHDGFSHSITHHYFLAFLRHTRPYLVMTSSYFNSDFFTARQAFATDSCAKFAVFQRGHQNTKIFEPNSLKDGDLFFCISESYAAVLNSIGFGGEQVASGSLPSKIYLQTSEPKLQKTRVGFVSQWRTPAIIHNLPGDRSHEDYYEVEISCLPLILNLLEDLGFKLEVIGASANLDEEVFFKKVLGDNTHSFLPRTSLEDSYVGAARYPLLLAANSTLALEALSAGISVMFLDLTRVPSRVPFWYPGILDPIKAKLLLKTDESGSWRGQITEILQLQEDEKRFLAVAVLGQQPMTSTIETFLDKLSESNGSCKHRIKCSHHGK